MIYKVLHCFEMPDGSETEELEIDDFIDKNKDKLANWDRFELFFEHLNETVASISS
ncbi:hypothetical protein SAMN06265827_10580 [Orenia metallireducens]|uniref:Uncharacterized protein n=1 Tax=Orenia metallireducens TaxID=1413210 RepID=A0A285G6J7_9FIRM|nr:hypothetical protein [Orenia metallireducens]SNY19202.1 hypothetical protein SAMN06265827_10580 [Orenia metallireducens]